MQGIHSFRNPWIDETRIFSKTLEAGLSHLKSLMESITGSVSTVDGFCTKILITAGESEHQGAANLGICVWSSSDEDEAVW